MNSLIAFYVFIFGLCFGSFLNVLVLRGLSGENFIMERSKCPKCGNTLKWYMNIPLISYIFLRGKCAFCREKISIQYPIVEFITGCCFLVSYLVFGLTFKALFMCLFFFFFITLALTDILETVIIDYHAYILFAAALLYACLGLNDITVIQALIGGISGFLIFEAIARLGYLFVKCRIFGEGDSLIALGLGAIFGVKNFLIIAFLSIFIQSILAIPVLILKSYKNKDYKLLSSYIIIVMAIFIVAYINFFAVIQNNLIYFGYLILILLALLWSLKNVLGSVKNKQELDFDSAKEKFTIFPFGPAMIIASMVGIFYIKQIKIAIKMFLY